MHGFGLVHLFHYKDITGHITGHVFHQMLTLLLIFCVFSFLNRTLGSVGIKGPQGDKGTRGNAGFAGFVGPAGKPGKQGETGPTGDIGSIGQVGPAGPDGKIQTGASSGYYVVRHSQNAFVPSCPRNYEVLWEGYSLMYTVGNGFAHSQDLGDAGSCSRSFRYVEF